jgi:hypothetical protein
MTSMGSSGRSGKTTGRGRIAQNHQRCGLHLPRSGQIHRLCQSRRYLRLRHFNYGRNRRLGGQIMQQVDITDTQTQINQLLQSALQGAR